MGDVRCGEELPVPGLMEHLCKAWPDNQPLNVWSASGSPPEAVGVRLGDKRTFMVLPLSEQHVPEVVEQRCPGEATGSPDKECVRTGQMGVVRTEHTRSAQVSTSL